MKVTLSDVPVDVLRVVLLQLDARTVARLESVGSRVLLPHWRDAQVWQVFYGRDFGRPTRPPTRVMPDGSLDWKGAYVRRCVRERARRRLLQARTYACGRRSGAVVVPVRDPLCAPLRCEGWLGTIWRYDWKRFQRERDALQSPTRSIRASARER
ncbi:hypothetical protein CDCA_CDCA16G4245 [Cyanidium caldarium]|uniref:F-box domain-containing protein n=1 Tax=Cyanidium caldarium TaxID=2771 RepID=A0AAV9J0V0_CYACA|nr:hypothetical protein CDCA_CDCA16G4245 [Cyanidium caldarium]